MKKIGYIAQIATLALVALTLVQCKKKEPKLTNVKEFTVDASDYTKWIYFSFEKNDVPKGVNDENFTNNMDWDIAFHRYDFRLNGGKSGKGKGMAVATDTKKFVTSIAIPTDDKFMADEMGPVLVQFENKGNGEHVIKYEDQPLNYVLTTKKSEDGNQIISKGAISSEGMPPKVKLSDLIYVVRSATGKNVLLKITDYRTDKGKTGHIKFQYVIVK